MTDTSAKARNQCEAILNHLQNIGDLSLLDAISLYGAAALRSRISDLRKRGFDIETKYQSFTSKFGHRGRYAVYRLKKSEKMEVSTETKPIEVTLHPPDQYGESLGSFSSPLSIRENVAYLWLRVNGQPAQKYRLDYGDAGTVGYARMQGQYAIGGRLTNVSMDWSNPKPTDYAILNMAGTIDNGNARLTVWRKETEP